MPAVSVGGKISVCMKGYSSLLQANVPVVFPNRGSLLMFYCQE